MRDEHLVEALARSRHDEAAATQQRLGEDLLRLIEGVRAQSTSRSLCLAGGLFFNTYFTTLAAGSGVFERTYVPAHPGRNGAAVETAILGAARRRSEDLASGGGGDAWSIR